ncbi:hypothetical protein IFM89_033960 [Coptis chinensis]|uniref:Uncharacterized protein n=1 Tax=Coptis chinensis TaxID=261450 RepID=A0A835HR91_9MAGN|nr:hypothetical protein IFM89_033960 [Coptis chinensis]
MELGSTSESQNKPDTQSGRPKPGPFVPRTDHSPRELKSWAKKTGFNPNFSGETVSSVSDRDVGVDLEKGSELEGGSSSPKIEIDPILGRTREDRGSDIEPVSRRYGGGAVLGIQKKRIGAEPVLDERETQKEVSAITPTEETKKEVNKDEEQVHIDRFSDDYEPEHRGSGKPSGMKWGLRENPSYATLIYYSLQHYLSLAGSLIFIPLIIVPAMGGTDKDTATVDFYHVIGVWHFNNNALLLWYTASFSSG